MATKRLLVSDNRTGGATPAAKPLPGDSPLRRTDPRLDSIPENVLLGMQKTDGPSSVSMPAVERLIMLVGEITSPCGRSLEVWETKLINDVYAGAVDTDRIRVVQACVLNAPSVLGNNIRVPPGYSFRTIDLKTRQDNRAVLIHEVGHIWQYQTMGSSYISDSVLHNSSAHILTGDRNVAYMNYKLEQGVVIQQFSAEQQAEIISDYFEITRLYGSDSQEPWVLYRRQFLTIYEDLIRQVRLRKPKTEHEIYQRDLYGYPEPIRQVPERELTPILPFLRVRF
jgi:hypothetical protein